MSQSAERIEEDWDHVASLAADLHDAHARLVDFVATVLAEGSWQAAGLRSPEHWLMLRAGLSRGQAAAVLLVARRAGELPETTAALRDGRISLDQAAVVARHTPAEFDATVAEFAQQATVTQLQRTVTRYDFTLPDPTLNAAGELVPESPEDREPGKAEPDDAEPGHFEPEGTGADDTEATNTKSSNSAQEPVEPAHLSMGYDADGRFRLRYDAPAEVGALIEAALVEAKDHLFHAVTPPGTAPDRQSLNGDVLDPRRCPADGGPPRVTWADALALVAARSLDAAGTTGSSTTDSSTTGNRGSSGSPATGGARRSRYRVQVHLDTDGGWLTGRPRLPQHIVNGLTCDGTLTPVWESEGHPVNVGRAQRVVPHRTRVLVLDRDRGCRFPGCGATRNLEIHHLVHWRDGGPTDLTNLLGLCPFHHDGHHRGEFTITGDPTQPDGLIFETRTGLLIGPPQPPRRPAQPELTVIADTDTNTGTAVTHGRPRPPSRLGRRYPAPPGGPLHLHLVDFTPA
ncbi:DUF222 domain-containing protein [Terrabacter sp. NPDC080008]|uniref:HNH endonuclease signature motif containing protein n=1 Tax=Terrabacter sp. NPDC080008 TaxID=3155176 RepID=UPI00344BD940